MLFTRERLLNLKGLPVAPEVKDINETFAAMEGQSNRGPGLATWRGELYFELHQVRGHLLARQPLILVITALPTLRVP